MFNAVDYLRSCEKWLNTKNSLEKTEWNYPLNEDCDFSLIIQAGVEGFNITIDGRHISSFPYQAVSYQSL